jgi:hypothetical protein
MQHTKATSRAGNRSAENGTCQFSWVKVIIEAEIDSILKAVSVTATAGGTRPSDEPPRQR